MKKKHYLSGLLVLGLIIGGFYLLTPKGDTTDATLNLGKSEKFSQKELVAGAKVAFKEFRHNYKNCRLKEVTYDEQRSEEMITSYLTSGRGSENGATRENVMVLLADFKTGQNSHSPGFNANSEYTGWHFILKRDNAQDKWQVDDAGY